MPRIVKAEVAQDLTNLLPVLESVSLSPDEVSSTLQLSQPLLPGTHKFRSSISTQVLGAVNSVTVNGPVVPADRYHYVRAATIHSTQATAARYSIGANHDGQFLVFVAVDDEAVVRDGGSHSLPLPRPILIGPGGFMVAQLDIPLVGQLVLNISYVEHLLLDPHPHF